MLLRAGNGLFVPASEPHFSLRSPPTNFRFRITGLHRISETEEFLSPVKRRSTSVCGHLQRIFEMMIEVITILFAIQCVSAILRLIERQRDVLSHVSKSDRSSLAGPGSGNH